MGVAHERGLVGHHSDIPGIKILFGKNTRSTIPVSGNTIHHHLRTCIEKFDGMIMHETDHLGTRLCVA